MSDYPIYRILNTITEDDNEVEKLLNNIKNNTDKNTIIEDYQKYASWTVKFNLLKSAIYKFRQINHKQPRTLLELASGRGNDLNRWIRLKVPEVVGIEVDPEQYNESVSRLNNSSNYKRQRDTKVEYVLGSALSNEDIKTALNNKPADIVACNFALNYFFKDKSTVDKFFATITKNMKKGSLFIGTCADGDVIDYLLNMFGPIDSYLYSLQRSENHDHGYDIALKTPYFEEGSKVYTEYLIHKKELVDVCRKYNLFPVKIDRYDPVVNFENIEDYVAENRYKHGLAIRVLYFRFSFEYRP